MRVLYITYGLRALSCLGEFSSENILKCFLDRIVLIDKNNRSHATVPVKLAKI
jgi:hypothetical protein